MKFTKRSITYITAALLVTGSVVACNHSTPEERSERVVNKITEELQLNDTQKANLAEVKDELMALRKTMRDNRDNTKAEIRSILAKPTFDRDSANSIVGQHIETMQARSPAIIDAFGDFYDSLDDAQRAELREFIEDKMEHGHRHRPW